MDLTVLVVVFLLAAITICALVVYGIARLVIGRTDPNNLHLVLKELRLLLSSVTRDLLRVPSRQEPAQKELPRRTSRPHEGTTTAPAVPGHGAAETDAPGGGQVRSRADHALARCELRLA
ncbi:hypothetical protein [Lentzea guizhouensis]|uniref:hypothetical protein n=1 Tax=Lentzea guizhouensis TaxID=1586287 RepID=UPI0012B68C5F|nr:hypothetical protein [Lentzea guizhouensis]